MKNEILHHRIQETFQSLLTMDYRPELDEYLNDNLNHNLRPYQEEALRHFIYTQRLDSADLSFNHLLFHMATGSGKTMVLASTILYLFYEKGKQNFIFFVNSDAIIKKTIDNLTNISSPKYLFNRKGIVIKGRRVSIRVVNSFPESPADNTIYLKLTTIQKLHKDLTNPRENGMTFETLEGTDIVLLADEAHHMNASTKAQKEDERTWEYTINRLLTLNTANRLLEFTATIDLTKDELFYKYQNKIVYQYDLKRFMEDGYSKNVVLLRANESDEEKLLSAILLSQYRKYIAKDNSIQLKPIIMFKSNTIKKSNEVNGIFNDLIEGLNTPELHRLIKKGSLVYSKSQSIYQKMYTYYLTKDLEEVIKEIKWDFKQETVLNVNSKEFLSEENSLLLNTLESPDNPVRVIFAVAKLNEGWDVLNLFDIVRISEGAPRTKGITDSEAQLIGRGARYYPYCLEGEVSYRRRQDYNVSDLKVIETLHYHTINDNSYIKNLQKSLDAAQIQIKEDSIQEFRATLKPGFKKNDFFKNGKIYINRLIETSEEYYQTLEDYRVNLAFETTLDSVVEQDYRTGRERLGNVERKEIELFFTKEILQKGIQRNPFFHFNHLSQYIPHLKSIREFIESENFLGNLKIYVSIPSAYEIEDLTPKDQLDIFEKFLRHAEDSIKNNFMKQMGTPEFEGYSISSMIKDYVVQVNQVSGRTMGDIIRERPMRQHDWFIYDKAIVNSLESDMIDFIIEYVEKLQEEYEEVYLIRNEKQVRVTEIDGVRGFMPDFLLYLKNEQYTYQVFMEPKGAHLLEKDKWKQDFLEQLSEDPRVEILNENEKVRLLGIKFYSREAREKEEFRNDFKEKLLSQKSNLDVGKNN
ncbi:DEAD/DEAH box helicase family protein [Aciduricibacillus chroicocephali]|uniref:DEAD/DEAH box helicase family protein n=1 Tax=Aciduricibacillus chroicocephali TaxID=3054939 RepID=A0ABY9L216_9BACI|nr:DEAD/DEAH box helicase family protein [Bacillaceae bacterium 44XB]